MQLSKILLPVDFSPRSDRAAHYAKTLACRFHSTLTIAHVFDFRDFMITTPDAGLPPGWYEDRWLESERTLAQFHVDEFQHLDVKRRLLEGDVAQSIIELAHADGANLIVMPTHGFGLFRRVLVGSVTAKILHDAECPVLTGVHLDEPPVTEPIFYRNILCAVDFDEAGEKALRFAAQFAAEFRAGLKVVHALPGLDEGQARYFDQGFTNMLRDTARERMVELQKSAGTNAEVILEPGTVSRVVHDAAVAQRVDLVVIGRHVRPGLLGRLHANAYSVVRDSPCPVLSV